MIHFKVSDEIGARQVTPVLEWAWDDIRTCSARTIIEERIRTECERIAHKAPATAFFADLSDGIDRYVDRIIERAIAAFVAGKLLLIVNDRQLIDLDETVPLLKANEAVFLKLVPLRGG